MIIPISKSLILNSFKDFKLIKAKVLAQSLNELTLEINNDIVYVNKVDIKNFNIKKGDILFLSLKEVKDNNFYFKVLYKQHSLTKKKVFININWKNLKDLKNDKIFDFVIKFLVENNLDIVKEDISYILKLKEDLLKEYGNLSKITILNKILFSYKKLILQNSKKNTIFKKYIYQKRNNLIYKNLSNFTKYLLNENYKIENISSMLDKNFLYGLKNKNYNFDILNAKNTNLDSLANKVLNIIKNINTYKLKFFSEVLKNIYSDKKDEGFNLIERIIYNYFLFDIFPPIIYFSKDRDKLIKFYLKKIVNKSVKRYEFLIRIENLDISPIIFLVSLINERKRLRFWVFKRDYISRIEKDIKDLVKKGFNIDSISLIDEKIKQRFYL